MLAQYNDLKNKKILVTGASSGIGRAIAIALDQQGATVVITGRNKEKLEATKKEMSASVQSVSVDLVESTQLTALVDAVENLDGVCHCAGIVSPFPVKFLQQKNLDEVFKINYEVPVLLTAELLRKKKLNTGCALLFMSSVSSDFSYKGGAVYAGSKAALEVFCRNVAIEHASKKMRANCIQAAMVKTEVYSQSEEFVSKELMGKHEQEYPLGVGSADDIAHAALFLMSDASRWITGTTLTMDGGLTAGK